MYGEWYGVCDGVVLCCRLLTMVVFISSMFVFMCVLFIVLWFSLYCMLFVSYVWVLCCDHGIGHHHQLCVTRICFTHLFVISLNFDRFRAVLWEYIAASGQLSLLIYVPVPEMTLWLLSEYSC